MAVRWKEQCFLNHEEAISCLPDGDFIHCQMNPRAGIFLGADWGRKEVIDCIRKAEAIEIGGPSCRATGHGLVVWTSRKENQFFEAVEARLLELDAMPAKEIEDYESAKVEFESQNKKVPA